MSFAFENVTPPLYYANFHINRERERKNNNVFVPSAIFLTTKIGSLCQSMKKQRTYGTGM